MTVEDFAFRLGELQGKDSARKFAQKLGIGEGTYRALLAGGKPTLDTLVAISRGAKVELEWLATGLGPKELADRTTPGVVYSGGGVGYVAIPSLDVRASAGAGALVVTAVEQEPEVVAFREDWLRRLGVSPKFARILVADGDSMYDTISHGDLMLLDVSIRDIVDEGVYVLVYSGLLKVKRVQLLRTGIVLLKSDNPRYQTEEVPLAEVPELIIEGRVRWAGGQI